MLGWPMLDNGHCRRGHYARAADPRDELGWAHSVLDPQSAEAASMSSEPAALAAVVKIRCWTDQGPAQNSPSCAGAWWSERPERAVPHYRWPRWRPRSVLKMYAAFD